MRAFFADGGSSSSGDRVDARAPDGGLRERPMFRWELPLWMAASPSLVLEGGDVFVASRGFLRVGLERSWRATGRGGGPPAGAVLSRTETRRVVIGALVGAVVLSSAKVLSFHSRSAFPFGWVQALRNLEKAPTSPYSC